MRRLVCAILVLLAAGCGRDASSPRAVIETDAGDVVVQVEIADSSAERAKGLMGRQQLPEDAGMVFLFPADSSTAFWMKDTLIPLSIAFYAADGRILRILDMQPCEADPCRLYDPEVSYRGALEVNEGAFANWGITEGDRLRITSP